MERRRYVGPNIAKGWSLLNSPVHFLEFWSKSPSGWTSYDFMVVTDMLSQPVPVLTSYITGLSLYLFYQGLLTKGLTFWQLQVIMWRRAIGLFLIGLLQNLICWEFPDDLLDVDILTFMAFAQLILFYFWLLPKCSSKSLVIHGVVVFVVWEWAKEYFQLKNNWVEKDGEEFIQVQWSIKDGLPMATVGYLKEVFFRSHFPVFPYCFFTFFGAAVAQSIYHGDPQKKTPINYLGLSGILSLIAVGLRVWYQSLYFKNKYTAWSYVVESHPPSLWILLYGFGVTNLILWICWHLYDSPTPITKLGPISSGLNFFGMYMLGTYFWQHVFSLVPIRLYSLWKYPHKKNPQWYAHRRKVIPWKIAAGFGWAWLIGFYISLKLWTSWFGGKYTLEWLLRVITGESTQTQSKPKSQRQDGGQDSDHNKTQTPTPQSPEIKKTN